MTYVIGIDGGGTKTAAALADLQGNIIAVAMAGPTNPNLISKAELTDTFGLLLQNLKNQAPEPYKEVSHLFAGISGAGIAQSRKVLQRVLTELVPSDIMIQVEPDTINALYSGTYGKTGIVQIAGTGSITYGINAKLEHDRVGGWGYLFGDEGSGYDIGRRGVISVLQAEDGYGQETMLTDMIYTFFDVTNGRDLIQKIYTSSVPKNEISPLSKIVFQAYKRHDPLAIKTIKGVAADLCLNIRTLYKKHFGLNEQAKIVLCGGVFNEKHILPQLIKRDLQDLSRITINIPKMSPVGGSVIGAYLMQKMIPSLTVIDNIIASLKEEDSR